MNSQDSLLTQNPRSETKLKNYTLWALQIGLAAMFVMAGYSKLSGDEQMVGLYKAIGVGQWFRYVTGVIEISGAILLLIPSLSALGAVILAATMIGAIATHLFIVGGSPALPIALLVVAAIIAYGRKDRLLALSNRK